MTATSWGVLLAIVIFFPGLDTKTICSETIAASCPSFQIVITDINATSSLAEDFFGQCNSKDQCLVENPNKECMEFSYYCTEKHDILMFGDDPHPTMRTESLFSIMSENYQKAGYQDAMNINCNLKQSGKRDDKMRTMKVTMIEFSPFGNATDYCFYVKDYELEPICSGSRKVFTAHGPFRSFTSWHFEMKLAADATQIPLVRFWMDIDISPNDDVRYHLECHSHPVVLSTTSAEVNEKPSPNPVGLRETSSATITISSVLGSLLLIAVFALIIGSAVTCRKRKIKGTRKSSVEIPQGDSPYTYIDINGIVTTEDIARSVLPSKEELAMLSKSCETLAGFKMQDRRLPSPPRERHHNDMEDMADQHLLLGAANRDADGSNVDESSDNDTDYLPPREELPAHEDETDQTVTRNINNEPVPENPHEETNNDNGEAPHTEEQGKKVEGNTVLQDNDDCPEDTDKSETTNSMTQDNDEDHEPDGANLPEDHEQPDGENLPEDHEQPDGENLPKDHEPDGANLPEDCEPDGAKLPENVYTHLSEDSLLHAEQRSRRTTYMRLDCKEGKDKDKIDEEGEQGDENTEKSDAGTDTQVDNEDTTANECEEKIIPEWPQCQEEEEPNYLVLIPGDEDLENALVSSEGIVDSKGAEMQ